VSHEAVKWALDGAPTRNGPLTLALVCFAERADNDGTRAFPGLRDVARRMKCKVRNVEKHVKELVETGLMREEPGQKSVANYRSDKRPIAYELAMCEEKRIAWASDYAAGGSSSRRAAHTSSAHARSDDPDFSNPQDPDPAVRSDTHDASDLSSSTERPALQYRTTCTPAQSHPYPSAGKPSLEPSVEPSSLEACPRADAAGDRLEDDRFLALHTTADMASATTSARRTFTAKPKERNPMPDDWEPDPRALANLKAKFVVKYPNLDPDFDWASETEQFREGAVAYGRMEVNWHAIWRLAMDAAAVRAIEAGTRIPADWWPSAEAFDALKAEYPDIAGSFNWNHHTKKFVKRNFDDRVRKYAWLPAWRLWMMNAVEMYGHTPPARPAVSAPGTQQLPRPRFGEPCSLMACETTMDVMLAWDSQQSQDQATW
jgi:hypothetical protein